MDSDSSVGPGCPFDTFDKSKLMPALVNHTITLILTYTVILDIFSYLKIQLGLSNLYKNRKRFTLSSRSAVKRDPNAESVKVHTPTHIALLFIIMFLCTLNRSVFGYGDSHFQHFSGWQYEWIMSMIRITVCEIYLMLSFLIKYAIYQSIPLQLPSWSP